MDRQKTKVSRLIPGLDRKAEEAQLSRIIGIAQANLEQAEKSGVQLADELLDRMEPFGTSG